MSSQLGGLVESASGEGGGLLACEQPAGYRGDEREPDDQGGQVYEGYIGEVAEILTEKTR